MWVTEVKRAERLCQSWIGLTKSSATAQGQHPLPFHSHVHMLQCDELDMLADWTENLLWEKKIMKPVQILAQKQIQLTAGLYKPLN